MISVDEQLAVPEAGEDVVIEISEEAYSRSVWGAPSLLKLNVHNTHICISTACENMTGTTETHSQTMGNKLI